VIDKKKYLHVGADEAYNDYKAEVSMKEAVQEVYNSIDYRMKKPDLLGKTLLVTDSQFPQINRIVKALASKIGITAPDVYVFEDFFYGIESYGMDEYWIEISAKTIRDFTDKELEFLFAREFYKIQGGIIYHTMLMNQMFKIYSAIPTVGDLMSKAVKNKFNHWCRLENFTADNFAYLCCKDLRASIDAIVATVLNSKSMLSQVDMKSFIKQASKINKLDDEVSNYTKADETLPYAPMRVESLLSYGISPRGMQARKEI
jgi:hypothetical protein